MKSDISYLEIWKIPHIIADFLQTFFNIQIH